MSTMTLRWCCALAVLPFTVMVGAPCAHAQEPREAAATAEERIHAALARPLDVEFVDTSLSDIAEWLRERLGCNVLLDSRSLAEVGLGGDTPVTFKLHGVSARAALRWLLYDLELTYTVRDEALVIGADFDDELLLTTRVYPVGDLLPDFQGAPDHELLVELIESTVSPHSWDPVGGPGKIEFLEDKLIVRQSTAIHYKLQDLLAALRTVKARHAADEDAVVAEPTFVGDEATHRRLFAALATRLDRVQFVESPLAEAVAFLAERVGAPLLIDRVSFNGVGLGTDIPVSLDVRDMTFAAVLRHLLREHELVYDVRDEVIWITTPEAAESEASLRIYSMRDLAGPFEGGTETWPLSSPYPGPGDFVDLILTVEPFTWDTHGGPGSFKYSAPAQAFVVRQTQDVHEALETLFRELRANSPPLTAAERRRRLDAWENQVDWVTLSLPTSMKLQQARRFVARLLPKEERDLPQWKVELARGEWLNPGIREPAPTAARNASEAVRTMVVVHHRRRVLADLVQLLREQTGDQPLPGGFFAIPSHD